MKIMRLPKTSRGHFALSVLKRWGLRIKHRPFRNGIPSFAENEGQLDYLLYDGHRYWRTRHKELVHDEEAQKSHNSDWDLVKRSFARRGIVLHS